MDGLLLFGCIFFWVAWIFMNGHIASVKGKSAGFFIFMSIVVSPVLMYLYLLAIPATPEEREEGEGKPVLNWRKD